MTLTPETLDEIERLAREAVEHEPNVQLGCAGNPIAVDAVLRFAAAVSTDHALSLVASARRELALKEALTRVRVMASLRAGTCHDVAGHKTTHEGRIFDLKATAEFADTISEIARTALSMEQQ